MRVRFDVFLLPFVAPHFQKPAVRFRGNKTFPWSLARFTSTRASNKENIQEKLPTKESSNPACLYRLGIDGLKCHPQNRIRVVILWYTLLKNKKTWNHKPQNAGTWKMMLHFNVVVCLGSMFNFSGVIPFSRIRSTETVSCPPWNKLAICHFVLLHEAAEALQHTLLKRLGCH